jgi:hypothetical protein
MWITQTYLGNVEPNASIFVYYFYEDYVHEQRSFTRKVHKELETLGDVYRNRISLLMPNPQYAGKVEAEVRANWGLWAEVCDNLPGLFLSTVFSA